MYRKYFGLHTKPFELLPDPDMMFLSTVHRKALSFLEYGLGEGSGFIMLTGEVGAGKTTIIKRILRKLDEDFSVAMVFNTKVDPQQLLTLINEDFGLKVDGKDKVTLLRELNHFLIEQCAKGKRPLLIIDEAQNLSAQALEEVRLLSNLETGSTRLLQTLLVGQPELRDIVSTPEMRQLSQRIAVHFHLNSLSREETQEYILFRLEAAGNRYAVKFAPDAIETVHERTGGTPRLINKCCDFLLLTAFAERTYSIDAQMVDDVVANLGLAMPRKVVELCEKDTDERDDAKYPGGPAALTSRVALHERFLHRLNLYYTRRFDRVEKRLDDLERGIARPRLPVKDDD